MRERNVSRRQFFTVSGAAAIAATTVPAVAGFGDLFAQQPPGRDPVLAQIGNELKRVHDAIHSEGVMRREHARAIQANIRTYIAYLKSIRADQKFSAALKGQSRDRLLAIDDVQGLADI